MSLEEGFLDAIHEDPADITSRLVYADWLDDHDDPRGEFIRVQTELAAWVPDLERRSALQRRELELLAEHHSKWLALRYLGSPLAHWSWHNGVLHVDVTPLALDYSHNLEFFGEQVDVSRAHDVRILGLRDFSPKDMACWSALWNVRSLDLSGNELTDADLKALVNWEPLTHLTRLNLSNNRLGQETIKLLRGLPQFKRLVHLDLRNNRLTYDAFAWLFISGETTRLRELALQGNNYSVAALQGVHRWCVANGGWTERFVNSLGMELTRIPAGTVLIGSPDTEPQRFDDESAPHPVTIDRAFYLGVYAVTQRQYVEVMEQNPSAFGGEGRENHPVESVSWTDAVEFCRRLSNCLEERKAGRIYRLPSEAEWEHACRAGTDSPMPHPYYHSLSSYFANFNGNRPYGSAAIGPFLERTAPVGSYPPNVFGLFDKMGNTWEWTADGNNGSRVCRGGSWASPGHYLRSADRGRASVGTRDHYYGFRVACDVT
jgi:uncharacterized protein (TIGR02996 family)